MHTYLPNFIHDSAHGKLEITLIISETSTSHYDYGKWWQYVKTWSYKCFYNNSECRCFHCWKNPQETHNTINIISIGFCFLLQQTVSIQWWNSICFKLCSLRVKCTYSILYSKRGLLNCGLRAAGCGPQIALRAAGCGSQIAGCGLRATLRLRAAGHRLRAAGCGPHSDCGLRATDCGLLTMCCGLRATCCGLLILLVAKLQVAKMSCCELLNCRLRFARLFRLGGCQLLDLLGYNIWVTGY